MNTKEEWDALKSPKRKKEPQTQKTPCSFQSFPPWVFQHRSVLESVRGWSMYLGSLTQETKPDLTRSSEYPPINEMVKKRFYQSISSGNLLLQCLLSTHGSIIDLIEN